MILVIKVVLQGESVLQSSTDIKSDIYLFLFSVVLEKKSFFLVKYWLCLLIFVACLSFSFLTDLTTLFF